MAADCSACYTGSPVVLITPTLPCNAVPLLRVFVLLSFSECGQSNLVYIKKKRKKKRKEPCGCRYNHIDASCMRSLQVSWRWYLCAEESPLYVLHPVSQVRLWHTDSLVQTAALTIVVLWCATTRWSCHSECLDCCCQDQNESMFTGRFSSIDLFPPPSDRQMSF